METRYLPLVIYFILLVDKSKGQAIYAHPCQEELTRKVSELQKSVDDLRKEIKIIFPDRDCFDGWIRFKNSCYKLFQTKMTWSEAQGICWDHGTKLVEIESMEEDQFLVKLIMNLNIKDDYWIGGVKGAYNVWMWSETNFTLATYNNWGPGEPNNRLRINDYYSDCIEIRPTVNYIWNDHPCIVNNTFLCEDQLET